MYPGFARTAREEGGKLLILMDVGKIVKAIIRLYKIGLHFCFVDFYM